MQCPRCQSKQLRKNGISAGKQRYLCRKCGRTFFSSPSLEVSLDVPIPSINPDLSNPSSDNLSYQNSVHEIPLDSSLSNGLVANQEADGKINLQPDLEPEIIKESSVFLNTIALDYRELLTLYKNLEANFIRLFKQQEEAGISILLLDVENIQLTAKAEKFLATLCRYPLQIKIAFGNWRRLANWDEEFHSRGYQMIHVPGGKDSADAKMTAVGASIFLQYPNVKEVLVCSSDWGLTHLYNSLQTYGIATYLVKENKEEKKVIVFNSQSDQTSVYSLLLSQSIPSLESLLQSIQEIITQQQSTLKQAWISLDFVRNSYQERTKFSIEEVLAERMPGKRFIDLLQQESDLFAIHQPIGQEELFVTLFQKHSPAIESVSLISEESAEIIESNEPKPETDNTELFTKLPLAQLKIQSVKDLEQALIGILNALTNHQAHKYVQLGSVGTAFRNEYGEALSTTMKRLEITGKLIKFIQSRPHLFTVKKESGQCQIAVVSA